MIVAIRDLLLCVTYCCITRQGYYTYLMLIRELVAFTRFICSSVFMFQFYLFPILVIAACGRRKLAGYLVNKILID